MSTHLFYDAMASPQLARKTIGKALTVPSTACPVLLTFSKILFNSLRSLSWAVVVTHGGFARKREELEIQTHIVPARRVTLCRSLGRGSRGNAMAIIPCIINTSCLRSTIDVPEVITNPVIYHVEVIPRVFCVQVTHTETLLSSEYFRYNSGVR